MSALFDMISAFIAMLMSAAFLHFGAAGDSPAAPAHPQSQAMASSAVPATSPADSAAGDSAPSVDDSDGDPAPAPATPARHHATHMASRGICHGAPPAVETVHALSPLRRG